MIAADPVTLARPKVGGAAGTFASQPLGKGVARTNALESLLISEMTTAEKTLQEGNGGPDITFETLVYDLGVVAENQRFPYSFRFMNTGDDTLHIESVVAS